MNRKTRALRTILPLIALGFCLTGCGDKQPDKATTDASMQQTRLKKKDF